MNCDEMRSRIEEHFRKKWGVTTPVSFDNVEADSKLKATKAANEPWVRVTIREGSSNLAGLALTKLYRDNGIIIVQVFTKLGVGTNTARKLAEQVRGILRYADIGNGLFLKAPAINPIGEVEGWYQINVTTPIQWDSIH